MGDDLLDQTETQRLGGAHLSPGEHELLRPGGADEAGQPLGSSCAGDDAEEDLRLTELRLVRGDPQVTGEGQLAATAEGEARDRRHGHPRDLGDGIERRAEQPADLGCLGRAPELGDVGPGCEHPIAAGHDHGTRWVVGQLECGPVELSQHLLGERVDLGMIEAEGGNAVIAALDVDERSFSHGRRR